MLAFQRSPDECRREFIAVTAQRAFVVHPKRVHLQPRSSESLVRILSKQCRNTSTIMCETVSRPHHSGAGVVSHLSVLGYHRRVHAPAFDRDDVRVLKFRHDLGLLPAL